MPRPPVDPDVVKAIEETWIKNPSQSATEVHRKLEAKKWRGYVGIRKVQQIVGDLKARGAGRVELTDWKPWVNPEETPEDSAYLLAVDMYYYMEERRHLYNVEAKWVRRLRVLLQGLEPRLQRAFVALYGDRELDAQNLQWTDAYTADLDAILLFRAWEQGGYVDYEIARSTGAFPPLEIPLAFDSANSFSEVVRSDEVKTVNGLHVLAVVAAFDNLSFREENPLWFEANPNGTLMQYLNYRIDTETGEFRNDDDDVSKTN